MENFTKKKLITDIKSLKDNLKELKNKYEFESFYLNNILNSINDGLYICDSKNNIVFINNYLKKLYGKVNNKKCFEYFYNRNDRCPWCNFNKIKKGETIHWEWNSTVDNKTYDIIESPLFNKNGSVYKIKVLRDITARKKANEKIKDLAKFPLENPNPVIRIDINKKIIFSNESGIQLLKYWNYSVGKKVNKKTAIIIDEVFTTKKNKSIEVKFNNKYYLLTFVPVIDKDYLNLYGQEITEQKLLEIEKENRLKQDKKNLKKEVELKDNEIIKQSELVDKIFENTHLSIAYLDSNCNFIRVNNAYAKADNKTTDFYPGKNHFVLFPNKENEKIFKDVIKTGKLYITYAKPFEYEKNPERGVTFWDWSLLPVKDKNDNVEGLILTLLNVTDRINNLLSLKKAMEELDQSKRLSDIGKLAATIAHELRTPLAVIEAAIYNIDRKCKNNNIEMHIENIEKKIKEAGLIISNLLSYAKIKMPVYEKIKINELLNECIENVKNRFINHDVKIIKNFNKNIILNIDPLQIKEVFTNILINSFQSLTKNKGDIKLDLKMIKNDIQVIFKDNGIGIEEKDLDKIFEPFFTKKTRGTGLGLSICREILNLHNGKIEIKSNAGVGTEVTVTIPKNKERIYEK